MASKKPAPVEQQTNQQPPNDDFEVNEGETEREQFLTDIATNLDVDDLADLIVLIAINEAVAEVGSDDVNLIVARAETLIRQVFSDVSEALDETVEYMGGEKEIAP